VYYGTSPSTLTKSIQIASPTATAGQVDALPSGTWYFAVTAYKASGAESELSAVVSKTL